MCQENLPSRDTYITVAVSVKYLDYLSAGSHTYDHTVPWIPSSPECLDILFHVLPHLTRSLFPSQAAILWSWFMSSSCRHQRPSCPFLSAWSISSHYFHRIKYCVSVSGVVYKQTTPPPTSFYLNKTTMRKHLTSVRTASIKKATSNSCWWGCGEKGGNVNRCSLYGKGYGGSSKN